MKGILLGDFLQATCIVLSGNNYQKMSLFSDFMNIGCIQPSAFYQVQSLYIITAMIEEFDMMRQELVDKYKDDTLVISGMSSQLFQYVLKLNNVAM